MTRTIRAVLGIVVAALVLAPGAYGGGKEALKKKDIMALMRRVYGYQIAHPGTRTDNGWIRGTFYTGVMALYETTHDPAVLAQAMKWARKHEWAEGESTAPANQMTCGQTYLQLYFLKHNPAMIAKIRAFMDRRIAANEPGRKVWFYCDSLYVAPPALAMMAKATGQRKYLGYLHRMYWDVADYLFDKNYGLFYRDGSYFNATTQNGKKVFWSRGNGWVIAGIPRILRYLPRDDNDYGRYVELFKALAAAAVRTQGADGLWRSNLTDPEQFPNPETSGSAFFCYALAWGVNNGYLPHQEYAASAIKAWKGLARLVQPDGKLGYVQPVGKEPAGAWPGQTHEYGSGAFLLAGSEMVKLAALDLSPNGR